MNAPLHQRLLAGLHLGSLLFAERSLREGSGCGRRAEIHVGQGQKISGFEQGDFFLGVFSIFAGGFQGRNGIRATELLGGFNGGLADFLFRAGQIGQNMIQGFGVVIHGPLLKAVELGVSGGLALFVRQGVGERQRGKGPGWRDNAGHSV